MTVIAHKGPTVSPVSSALVTPTGLYTPQYLNKLIMARGDQGLKFLAMLRTLCLEVEVKNFEFKWIEDRQYVKPIKCTEKSGGGANPLVITIHADSIDTGRYPLQVGDQVMFSNEQTGVVSAVSYPDVTITTVGGNLPTTAAYVTLLSYAGGEGSNQPGGWLVNQDEYTNYVQNIKHTYAVTDRADMQALEVSSYDGKSITCMSDISLIEADYQFLSKIVGMMLYGQKGTTATGGADRAGNQTAGYTSEGIMTTARTYGLTHSTTPGNFDIIDDFDEIDRLFRTQNVTGGNHWLLAGSSLMNDLENSAAQFSQSSTDFTKVVKSAFGGNEERALSVAFRTYTKGSRTYLVTDYDYASNPNFIDESWSTFPQQGLIMPMGSVTDPKTRMAMDFANLCYMRHPKANLKLNNMGAYTWQQGAFSDGNQDEFSDRVVYYSGYYGMRTPAANRLLRIN